MSVCAAVKVPGFAATPPVAKRTGWLRVRGWLLRNPDAGVGGEDDDLALDVGGQEGHYHKCEGVTLALGLPVRRSFQVIGDEDMQS